MREQSHNPNSGMIEVGRHDSHILIHGQRFDIQRQD
jgi:hypothetical protein